MARSVSYPYGAIVAYDYFEANDDDDFGWIVEDYVDQLKRKYRSVYDRDGWLGREDRIVAANDFAFFGISEYCGMIAKWAVLRNDLDYEREGLAENWLQKIGVGFQKEFGQLRKIGQFSNGEAIYERAA